MNRVLALLVVAACAPAGPHIRQRMSTTRLDPTQRDVAFSRALQTVQREGWIIAVSDRAAGILTTQSMNTGIKPCGKLTCDSRSTLQITIVETGDVTVKLHRELYAPGGVGWFVPTYEPDVRPIEAEQDAILAAIVGQRQSTAAAIPALFVPTRAPTHQWPEQAQRSYRENCAKTLAQKYGDARTTDQLRYACECITWTWQDRYALEDLHAKSQRDPKSVQDETVSISAECKKTRPASLGPDPDAAR